MREGYPSILPQIYVCLPLVLLANAHVCVRRVGGGGRWDSPTPPGSLFVCFCVFVFFCIGVQNNLPSPAAAFAPNKERPVVQLKRYSVLPAHPPPPKRRTRVPSISQTIGSLYNHHLPLLHSPPPHTLISVNAIKHQG